MDDPSSPPPAAPRPRSCLPIVVGIVIGLGLSLYFVRQYYGNPLPEVTPDSLKQAEIRWRDAAIRDYDIEIEVQSRQKETYAVEVRDGTPQQAWRNGRPLKQIRTFDTWSVPGMFGTMHSDIDRPPEQKGHQVTLHAEFDPKTGVPLRYKRIPWDRSDPQVSWKVTKFEALHGNPKR
jgi:hypothetical protein